MDNSQTHTEPLYSLAGQTIFQALSPDSTSITARLVSYPLTAVPVDGSPADNSRAIDRTVAEWAEEREHLSNLFAALLLKRKARAANFASK